MPFPPLPLPISCDWEPDPDNKHPKTIGTHTHTHTGRSAHSIAWAWKQSDTQGAGGEEEVFLPERMGALPPLREPMGTELDQADSTRPTNKQRREWLKVNHAAHARTYENNPQRVHS